MMTALPPAAPHWMSMSTQHLDSLVLMDKVVAI